MRARLIVAVVLLTGAVARAQMPSEGDISVERALTAAHARAEAGDAMAQFSLGAFLYYGSDRLAEALDWVRKAAAQAYPPAEFHLGQYYDFGFASNRNEAQALLWYRRAAEHGDAAAQRALGNRYQKGLGVAADPAEAVRWLERAADGDDLRAQYALGQMYFDGAGIPRDYVSAYVWFSIAAGQTPLLDNRKGLIELRNIAAVRMTAEQAAEAERRVKAWKPRTSR